MTLKEAFNNEFGTWHDEEPHKEMPGNLITTLVDEVGKFNRERNIQNPGVMWNVAYLALALNGEAGEVANAVKKIIRDGHSDAMLNNLREEIVDVCIYVAMLVEALNMNFDYEFQLKQAVLEGRFQKFQKKGFGVYENLMKQVGEL